MAPADVAAHVQRRVKRIAEQAFWDSVQATLADSSSGVSQQQVTGQLAGLLAHMGQELMAVLPEQARAAREQLAAELDEGRLQEALTAHQVSVLLSSLCAHNLCAHHHLKCFVCHFSMLSCLPLLMSSPACCAKVCSDTALPHASDCS